MAVDEFDVTRLPGILCVKDGRTCRNAQRDGQYLIGCLSDCDWAKAAAYLKAGADLTVVERVRDGNARAGDRSQ